MQLVGCCSNDASQNNSFLLQFTGHLLIWFWKLMLLDIK